MENAADIFRLMQLNRRAKELMTGEHGRVLGGTAAELLRVVPDEHCSAMQRAASAALLAVPGVGEALQQQQAAQQAQLRREAEEAAEAAQRLQQQQQVAEKQKEQQSTAGEGRVQGAEGTSPDRQRVEATRRAAGSPTRPFSAPVPRQAHGQAAGAPGNEPLQGPLDSFGRSRAAAWSHLPARYWAEHGASRDQQDREGFEASGFTVRQEFDPVHAAVKRVAKPGNFSLAPDEALRRGREAAAQFEANLLKVKRDLAAAQQQQQLEQQQLSLLQQRTSAIAGAGGRRRSASPPQSRAGADAGHDDHHARRPSSAVSQAAPGGGAHSVLTGHEASAAAGAGGIGVGAGGHPRVQHRPLSAPAAPPWQPHTRPASPPSAAARSRGSSASQGSGSGGSGGAGQLSRGGSGNGSGGSRPTSAYASPRQLVGAAGAGGGNGGGLGLGAASAQGGRWSAGSAASRGRSANTTAWAARTIWEEGNEEDGELGGADEEYLPVGDLDASEDLMALDEAPMRGLELTFAAPAPVAITTATHTASVTTTVFSHAAASSFGNAGNAGGSRPASAQLHGSRPASADVARTLWPAAAPAPPTSRPGFVSRPASALTTAAAAATAAPAHTATSILATCPVSAGALHTARPPTAPYGAKEDRVAAPRKPRPVSAMPHARPHEARGVRALHSAPGAEAHPNPNPSPRPMSAASVASSSASLSFNALVQVPGVPTRQRPWSAPFQPRLNTTLPHALYLTQPQPTSPTAAAVAAGSTAATATSRLHQPTIAFLGKCVQPAANPSATLGQHLAASTSLATTSPYASQGSTATTSRPGSARAPAAAAATDRPRPASAPRPQRAPSAAAAAARTQGAGTRGGSGAPQPPAPTPVVVSLLPVKDAATGQLIGRDEQPFTMDPRMMQRMLSSYKQLHE